ncbi:MAG: signal peptidase II, partial [Clostridia bacterium]|nr:signal peptidase II [Clostridia bacterium]
FNVADSCITVGAVLLGVYILFFEPKVEKRLAAQKAAEQPAPEPENLPEPDNAPEDKKEND